MACLKAGVDPTFADYKGADPLRYVVSRNLHRRHLNDSQRAQVAQQLWKQSQSTDAPQTQEQAAEALNVGVRSVRRAARIAESASEEVQSQIAEGTLSLCKAEDALTKAKELAGANVAELSSEDGKQKLQRIHEQILNGETPGQTESRDEEFNKMVQSGVFDGKRYKKNIREIQSILSEMEKYPGLLNDSIELASTKEEEMILSMLMDMVVCSLEKVQKQFLHPVSVNKEKLRRLVQGWYDAKFNITEIDKEIERTDAEGLELLKQKYIAKCDEIANEAKTLCKRFGGKLPLEKESTEAI